MKNIAISGSIAYDYIMDFPDSFSNHILPDHIHTISVSFNIERLQRHVGGTAGNIAYTVKLLQENPLMLAAMGTDADMYEKHWETHNISSTYVLRHEHVLTASAHITTDKDDNQITAFYPGALTGIQPSLTDVNETIDFAILAPNNKHATLQHATECQKNGIPFVFDPGQQITTFTTQELMRLIGQSDYLIGNDYEMKLIEDKTGWDTKELLNHTNVVIITLGAKGSVVISKDTTIEVPAAPVQSVEDPTGAGDAYRAGFFTALVNEHDLQTCAEYGSIAASYAIETYGTQEHVFTKEIFMKRYHDIYGTSTP